MFGKEAAYSSHNPYAAPSTGNPFVSAYSTNTGSIALDERAPVQYPKLVRKYPSYDFQPTSYDSQTTSYDSHSTSYPLKQRGYPGLPLGQTPEKNKIEEKPWNNRPNPKEVLSEIQSKLKESSRYYGSTRSREISPGRLPFEPKVEKDHEHKSRRRSRGCSKQRSRSRSRSRSRRMHSKSRSRSRSRKSHKKKSKRHSRSRSRSPKPHKMKNSSSDSRSMLLDPNRIPTPPPPPILTSYDSSPGRPMESMEKPADKPEVHYDKEKGSLSCLLEAVMENIGQRKSQVNDPKVKREILSNCESKIRQLYKRRTSGIGAFIPDSFVPRLINSCGSPLITFHPHITFNNEPEASVWNCLDVEVPSVKKIDPTLSISTTIFSTKPLNRQESSSQKTFHNKDTLSSDAKTNDPEEFPQPYVRTGSGWPVYKPDIENPTPTNQSPVNQPLPDLPQSNLKKPLPSIQVSINQPSPVNQPPPVPMVHQILPLNYLPPNHTAYPQIPFNPNYGHPSNYPSPMPSTHIAPGYGYYYIYNFPKQNPNFNQQQIHSQNIQSTSEAIDPVKEAQERFIRKLQRGEPIRSGSKDSSSLRNLRDDRYSTSSRKRSHYRQKRNPHDKNASDIRNYPIKRSRDDSFNRRSVGKSSEVTTGREESISMDSSSSDWEGSVKSRENKSEMIEINFVDDKKSLHSNVEKDPLLTVENVCTVSGEAIKRLQMHTIDNDVINSVKNGDLHGTHKLNNGVLLQIDNNTEVIVIPSRALNDFVNILHRDFHHISKPVLFRFIMIYVYNTNGHLNNSEIECHADFTKKAINNVKKYCCKCKLNSSNLKLQAVSDKSKEILVNDPGNTKIESPEKIFNKKEGQLKTDMSSSNSDNSKGMDNVDGSVKNKLLIEKSDRIENISSNIDSSFSLHSKAKVDPMYDNRTLSAVKQNVQEMQNKTWLGFEDLLSLGPQLRSFQDRSSLYKGVIETIINKNYKDAYQVNYRLKNNVLCKGRSQSRYCSARMVVVPKEFLKDFIILLHETFHSVDRNGIIEAIESYVYPKSAIKLYVKEVFYVCNKCNTSKHELIDKKQQTRAVSITEAPSKHLNVSSCEKQEQASTTANIKETEPLIQHTKPDDSSDESKIKNLTPSVQSTKQLKSDNSSDQKHKETGKPKAIPPDNRHIQSTNCTDIATAPPLKNIKVDISLDEIKKETMIQTVSKIESPMKHLKVNDSPDETDEAPTPTVSKTDPPITQQTMGNPSNEKLDQTVSCVIIKSESSYDKSTKGSPEDKSDEQAINITKATNDRVIQAFEEKTLVQDKSSKNDVNNSLTINSTIILIEKTENSREKAIEESKTNINETNIKKNESSNFSNSNVASSDRMDSKSNSIPKQNVPSLDFKGRIREVQLKSKEFCKKLIRMESGNISDKNEDNFMLKVGMLCKKVLTNNKPEVKIVAPPSEVESLIEIVHTMSVTHSPPDKVVAFFSKHFTPVEELEIKVNKYIKKCSLCS